MIEREVKILGISKQQVEKNLKALGAEKTFDGKLYAVFYDTEDRKLKEKGQTLRLRKSPETAVLTLKTMQSKEGLKEAEEIEVTVSDFNEMRQVLGKIGFSERKSLTKHRTSYRIEDTTFDLDKYWDEFESIPEFMEIEGPDAETVFKYAEQLGFKREDCKPWDTGDLIRHYKDQN